MKYEYKTTNPEGIVEANDQKEANSKALEQLGLEVNEADNRLADVLENYTKHSATFMDVITDWSGEQIKHEAPKLARMLTREYRIYLLDTLNTEGKDVKEVERYEEWEEKELDRLLTASGTSPLEFSIWMLEEYL